MKDLKVVFMGTPDFSTSVLESLINNCKVVLVVTQPDKEVGRKKEVIYNPVKKMALENNINVFQPAKIRNDYEEIINTNADIIITCAYGQIIPNVLLNCFKYKAINVHASYLPYLRGGAPIHHAIIDNYEYTGITIMYMDEEMDNGDIISQIKVPILLDDNVGILHDRLKMIAPKLLIDTLPSIIDGSNKRIKQNKNMVTFGFNIKREEEQINFYKTGLEIYNQIRGLNPFPVAYMTLNQEEVKVYDSTYIIGKYNGKCGEIISTSKDSINIKCADGLISILEIKPFGKKKMLVKDYLNGLHDVNLIGVVINE